MITDQTRKQLQKLMSEANWAGFEAFFDDFMKTNFIQQSIKREDQFSTLWYAAEQEGAKRKLMEFKTMLEEEARKAQ